MNWKNSSRCYGWGFALLHWLMALWLLVVFVLGLWMVGLDYYHPWSVRAPDWHRSLGVLAGVLLVLRVAWRWMDPPPPPQGTAVTRFFATTVHRLFYVLMIAVVASGYLISTAKGGAVTVFDWFSIPAWPGGFEAVHLIDLESRAGDWHRWLSYGLAGLAVLHAGAAFWHHFFVGDGTLWRIAGRCPD